MTHEESDREATVQDSAPAAEWSIRPFRDEDVPGIVALVNAVFDAYHLQEGVSEDDLRNDLSVPGSEPARQALVVDGPRLNGLPPGMPVASCRPVPGTCRP